MDRINTRDFDPILHRFGDHEQQHERLHPHDPPTPLPWWVTIVAEVVNKLLDCLGFRLDPLGYSLWYGVKTLCDKVLPHAAFTVFYDVWNHHQVAVLAVFMAVAVALVATRFLRGGSKEAGTEADVRELARTNKVLKAKLEAEAALRVQAETDAALTRDELGDARLALDTQKKTILSLMIESGAHEKGEGEDERFALMDIYEQTKSQKGWRARRAAVCAAFGEERCDALYALIKNRDAADALRADLDNHDP